MKKEIIELCLEQGIDKYVDEFTVLRKGDSSQVICFSEEFSSASDYGREIVELENDGYEIIFEGSEEDVYDIRAIEEDGESIEDVCEED